MTTVLMMTVIEMMTIVNTRKITISDAVMAWTPLEAMTFALNEKIPLEARRVT